mgnify:CR=1 FL=1
MGLIVQKFGGTSVADLDRIRNVAKRVARTFDQGNDCLLYTSDAADDWLVVLFWVVGGGL